MAPNRQLDAWAAAQLGQQTGFGGGELDQIVNHLVSLTSADQVAEFLTGMVGTEPSALTFIAEFNERRFPKMKTVGAWTAAPKIPQPPANAQPNGYRKPPAESYMLGAHPAGKEGVFLSDKLRTSQSAARSPTASPAPSIKPKAKKMNVGQAAAALDDIDGMVKVGSAPPGFGGRVVCECLAAIHGLVTNCLNCGKIVCRLEGEGPCSSCGTRVHSKTQQITLVQTKKREHQSRKAKTKAGDGYVGAGYGRAAGAQIPSGFNKAAAVEVDPALFPNLMLEQDREALAKADAQRARLLDYQKNSTARTRVHDTASDFSYQEDAQNKWLSAEERALALRKAKEEQQWAEDQKRRRVITLDLKNKRVTTAVQQNPFAKSAAASEAVPSEAHIPTETPPLDPRSTGQFRHPTIRITPVYTAPSKSANLPTTLSRETSEPERVPIQRRRAMERESRKPQRNPSQEPPPLSVTAKPTKKKTSRPQIRRLQHDLEGFQEDEIYAQMELAESGLGTETTCGLPVSPPTPSALSQSDIFTTSGFSIPVTQPPAAEFLNPFAAGTSSSLASSPTTASPRSGSHFFCHTCKKSFATQATYVAHQKTARHVAALKELQRKVLETGGGGERKGRKASAAVPPAAVEAARKVGFADSLMLTDPAKAATVYWSVASELWTHNRIRETAECLSKLIAALTRLQMLSPIPSDAGQSSSPRPPPAVLLKPSQIVETMFLARIALARLLATYDCDASLALYVDALAGKYGVPFGEMGNAMETSSLATFFAQTQEYLNTHVKLTFKKKLLPSKRAPEVADTSHPPTAAHGAVTPSAAVETDLRTSVALRKFLMVLLEAMSFAANVEAPREAALLGGMAAVVAAEERRWAEYVDVCARLSDIFQSLDRPWASCDCLELAAGAARSVTPDEPVPRGPNHDAGDDDDNDGDDLPQGRQGFAPGSSSSASPDSRATSELVLLCDALMIAIYIDDRVRIRRLEARITELCEREQQVQSPEMQFLLDLARSARVLDHQWKDEVSAYAFDGLDLGRFLPTAPRSRDKVLSVWRAWSRSELGRAG
ncbi:hypothetical protein HDU87_007345 [Geranomyces variabilis]|uniref:C2H2-type domain-containing protein n=1 Tax=Geranomyces variabilis TaxID=109894 RepID=A0AAD5TJH0_9FUNG|nr:hypothetical protein HDU87_007345 [Geranomyces variabilis]